MLKWIRSFLGNTAFLSVKGSRGSASGVAITISKTAQSFNGAGGADSLPKFRTKINKRTSYALLLRMGDFECRSFGAAVILNNDTSWKREVPDIEISRAYDNIANAFRERNMIQTLRK